MKKFILLTLMALVPMLVLSQQKVLVDGIFYYFDDSSLTAEVTNDESYSYSGDVVIPASVDYNNLTYSVTSIGPLAFSRCSGLTSIDIPASIVTIGDDAFHGCSSLERVNISDLAAWCGIEFGDTYRDWYPNAPFDNMPLYLNGELIEELVIPEVVTEIKGGAFYNCSSLTSVIIPNNVQSVKTYAFRCDQVKIFIVDSDEIHFGTTSLELFNLRSFIIKSGNPPSISLLPFLLGSSTIFVPYGTSSFYRNYEDEDGINRWSLYKNYKEYYVSPEGIYCGLESEEQTAKVISTDYYGFTDPMEVKIPQTIECDGVSYAVTGIGHQAFEINRSVTSISLPGTLTTVDDLAFHKCTGLTEMYCYAEEVPATSETAFEGSNAQEAILYVPAASVESYRASYPWNTFKEIRPITTTAIDQLNVIGENHDAQKETFRLDGQRVTDVSLLPSGSIVVVRKGETFEKVMVK